MNFKTLLSVVDVSQSNDDLKTAIALCSELNAQLTVMVVTLASLPLIGDYSISAAEDYFKQRQDDLDALARRVDEIEILVRDANISAAVTDEYPEMARAGHLIGQHARYADVTLIGADLLAKDGLRASAIDGALFESGRPILIIPKGSKPTSKPKCVLLAWDSGVECTRAAREALDFMVSASEVHVTMIDPDTSSIANGAEPGADIAAYLAHHGVKIIVDRLRPPPLVS